MMVQPRIDLRMKRDALLASPLFREMQPEELNEILGFAHERHIAKGTTIFRKGDSGSFMMALLIGRVRVGNVSQDGKEITLNVIGPGEVLGEIALLDGDPRSADAVALEDITFIVVERRDFMPFLRRHPPLMERLLTVLCERLRRTSLALEEVALFDLPARLARALVKLASDYGRAVPDDEGGGVRIGLKLSQRDISTLVASSRESVNKQLRVWREGRFIDQREGHIVLINTAGLRALYE
jgi:CRP/FNR family cyclic AMP-dependent transcriptional regulator